MTPWLISPEHCGRNISNSNLKNPQPFPTEQCQHNRRQTLHFNVITLHWSQRRAISFSPLCVRSIHTHTFILSLDDILSAPRAQIEWERERESGSILRRVKKETSKRDILLLSRGKSPTRARDSKAFKVNLQLILHCCVGNTSIFCLPLFSHSLRRPWVRELSRVSGLNSCPATRFISVC